MIASQAYEEAIRNEAATEYSGHVIGFFTVICVLDPDRPGGEYYDVIVPEGQPRHSSIGLADLGVDFATDRGDDDDDEG